MVNKNKIEIETLHLFTKIDFELIELLKSLSPNEWSCQTINKSFCKDYRRKYKSLGSINLLTSANISSYIDNFIGRNVNAFDLINSIKLVLDFVSLYSWFIE